ncbi:MAG: hypothetical protein ABIR06_07960 [Cyclobacteriaceae bacterium]
MKNLTYTLPLLAIISSCDTQEIKPQIDKLVLLSGDNPNGKQWSMTSFKTVSNYCTSDINKFQTTESWDSYPESIKDNITIIYPGGHIKVDEGVIKYSDDSPQIYIDRQFWTLNTKQDSVAIDDYIGLPSINDTWGLEVSKNKIVLTRKELNIVFKGSSLSQSVTFDLIID